MRHPTLKTKAARELLLRLGGPDKRVQMRVIDVVMSQETIDLLKQEVEAHKAKATALDGELKDVERVNHEVFAELQACRSKLDRHQRFEERLRSYLAGSTDCHPSDLEAMMDDELPKEAATHEPREHHHRAAHSSRGEGHTLRDGPDGRR